MKCQALFSQEIKEIALNAIRWWKNLLKSTHNENMPIQIYWKFHHQKNENFQTKNSDIFYISAQNIDNGYSIERLGEAVLTSTHNLCFWAEIRKITYTPVNPSFTV